VSVKQNINIFISQATSFGCSSQHQALSQGKGTETHSVCVFVLAVGSKQPKIAACKLKILMFCVNDIE
jgi:hypothetical protein